LGDVVHVESILVNLAQREQYPVIADVSGHGWFEVDEPAERAWAESQLARDKTSHL
jgi:hypothetical protein